MKKCLTSYKCDITATKIKFNKLTQGDLIAFEHACDFYLQHKENEITSTSADKLRNLCSEIHRYLEYRDTTGTHCSIKRVENCYSIKLKVTNDNMNVIHNALVFYGECGSMVGADVGGYLGGAIERFDSNSDH